MEQVEMGTWDSIMADMFRIIQQQIIPSRSSDQLCDRLLWLRYPNRNHRRRTRQPQQLRQQLLRRERNIIQRPTYMACPQALRVHSASQEDRKGSISQTLITTFRRNKSNSKTKLTRNKHRNPIDYPSLKWHRFNHPRSLISLLWTRDIATMLQRSRIKTTTYPYTLNEIQIAAPSSRMT